MAQRSARGIHHSVSSLYHSSIWESVLGAKPRLNLVPFTCTWAGIDYHTLDFGLVDNLSCETIHGHLVVRGVEVEVVGLADVVFGGFVIETEGSAGECSQTVNMSAEKEWFAGICGANGSLVLKGKF